MSKNGITTFIITPAAEDNDMVGFVSNQPEGKGVEMIASMRYDPCEANKSFDNTKMREIMTFMAQAKGKQIQEKIAGGPQIGGTWAHAQGGHAYFCIMWF